MTAREAIDRIAQAFQLSLEGIEQDWELLLADPDRISEFVSAYGDSSFDDEDRRELMRLILASADVYVQRRSASPPHWEEISRILVRDRHLHQERIDYWACTGEWASDDPLDESPDELFALTPFIRATQRSGPLGLP